MHPRDFNFNIRTGHDMVQKRPERISEMDDQAIDMLSMSMVFFEEAVRDSSLYCVMNGISDITDVEIIMGLKAQLLRNDGKSFLDTSDLIQRSNSYREMIIADEEGDEEDEDEPIREEGETKKPEYTDDEKKNLNERFEFASACWDKWQPEKETNFMAYFMKQCIQSTIDKMGVNA